MTIDEYMQGWLSGTGAAECENHYPQPQDDYERGYAAGRAAYLAAEQAERERLEREPCTACGGGGELPGNIVPDAPFAMTYHREMLPCPRCHGTGRRGA